MEPFEARLTKSKCHAAVQTAVVDCNLTSDWRCSHQHCVCPDNMSHDKYSRKCSKIFVAT